MNRVTLVLLAALTTLTHTSAKSLQLKHLPKVVQGGIEANLQGGQIKTISKEVEKGVTQYEIETIPNGKHRDFNVDEKGALVVVEQEVELNTIPTAAREAIEKKVAGSKIGTVETVTKGDVVFYEAGFTTKSGKKSSILVRADGQVATNF